jgi:hypothetical protein
MSEDYDEDFSVEDDDSEDFDSSSVDEWEDEDHDENDFEDTESVVSDDDEEVTPSTLLLSPRKSRKTLTAVRVPMLLRTGPTMTSPMSTRSRARSWKGVSND